MLAFGFRSPQALIALAMLNLGGHPPALDDAALEGDEGGSPAAAGPSDPAVQGCFGLGGR